MLVGPKRVWNLIKSPPRRKQSPRPAFAGAVPKLLKYRGIGPCPMGWRLAKIAPGRSTSRKLLRFVRISLAHHEKSPDCRSGGWEVGLADAAN